MSAAARPPRPRASRSAAEPAAGIYRSAAGEAAIKEHYRALLDGWPVPCQRIVVPTSQGETFVIASGPDGKGHAGAPPLLALHGSGSNSAMWMGQVARLAAHLRVYTIDLIGEPGLSAQSRPTLGSEAYAVWLDDVLRELGLSRVSLLGVSLGGWLAVDYATRRPERVERLIGLNPGGIGRAKASILVALMLGMFGASGRRASMRWMLGSQDMPEEATEYLALIFRNFKPRMGLPVFDDEVLRALTMPVLAILGGRDAMLRAEETSRRLSTLVPSASISMLAEAGHLLPDTTDEILGFLLREIDPPF